MSEKKKIYLFRPMFRLMFNNLTKLAKILTRENSMQQVLFNFSRSTGSIKNFI